MENDSVPGTSETTGLSQAEQLRQRRRQKILNNQGSRMNKILGSDSHTKSPLKDKVEDPPFEDDNWTSFSQSGIKVEESVDNGVTIIRKTRSEASSSSTSNASRSAPTTNANIQPQRASPSPSPDEEDSPPSALGFMRVHADGSTTHPKISAKACRFFLCILSVCLSVFNARYLLVTFFSWEMAVLAINGLPDDESNSSVFVLLIALMGFKEPQLKRVKLAFRITYCLLSDLSLFIVFALLARVVI